MSNVLPQRESGALARLLPDWYADGRAQQLTQRFLATQASIGHGAAVK